MVSIGQNTAAAEQLTALLERMERLLDEIDGLKNDLKDLKGQARDEGFNVAALVRLVAIRRNKGSRGPGERAPQRSPAVRTCDRDAARLRLRQRLGHPQLNGDLTVRPDYGASRTDPSDDAGRLHFLTNLCWACVPALGSVPFCIGLRSLYEWGSREDLLAPRPCSENHGYG